MSKRVLDTVNSFSEKTIVTVGNGCTLHARIMDRRQCLQDEAFGLSLRPESLQPDTALTHLASIGMPRCRSQGVANGRVA